VIEAEGFSYEQFTSEFFRFITPAISSGESSHNMDVKDFAAFGFFLTEPIVTEKRKRKKS
jgi:TetR/AcrR family transcriptional regulator